MYAEYEYYRDCRKGKLTEAEFSRLAEKAEAYINAKTDFLFEREGMPAAGTSLERRLKGCVCALVDAYKSIETGTKTSETVGSHSVSYTVAKTGNECLREILDTFLPDAVKAVKWV